jgi:hypothetical protein
MKQKLFYSALLYLLLAFGTSCKKAGLAGDNTIVAYPQHHGKPIFSHSTPNYRDTIYVKFNAVELPGTNPSNFDKVFVGEIGENHVHIHGLQKGKYYLYGVGWDTTISQRVSGGIPIELKQLTAETDIDVPVTE